MNLLDIWRATWRHKREISLMWIIQLVLGFIIGMATYSLLYNQLSDDGLTRLQNGFDRTVFMDILNNHDRVLDPIQIKVVVVVLFYLLISAFIHAGLLHNVVKGIHGISGLFNGVKQFGLPFLAFAFVFLILAIILVAGIWIPFFLVIGDPLLFFHSEKPFVQSIIVLIILTILVWVTLWAWSIITRKLFIRDPSFFKSISQGFHLLCKGYIHYLGFGLFLFFVVCFLTYVMYFINGDRGASSWGIVIFGVFIQQIFAWIKVFIRTYGYNGVVSFDQ